MMFETTNTTPCNGIPKVEPVKMILENMDAILKELFRELIQIDSAIYSPKPSEGEHKDPTDDCMLATLNRQRDALENLLKLAVHIREGLW